LNTSRVTAGLYARVPETVVMLLLSGTLLALGMVGYSAGLAGKRSVFSAVVLAIALGAVLMLVIDMDRAQDGFLQTGQQPLIDLQQDIGPPYPPRTAPGGASGRQPPAVDPLLPWLDCYPCKEGHHVAEQTGEAGLAGEGATAEAVWCRGAGAYR
ncbi:MAG: hypothetical protein R6W93_16175, partial [Candidatus Limnocylindrales bacterium]